MNEINIKKFTFNDFQENTYVLNDTEGNAIIVDPGCSNSAEDKTLFDYVKKESLQIHLLFNTHCHIDHVLGNYSIVKNFSVPFLAPKGEEATLESCKVIANMYGMYYNESPKPDKWLTDQDSIKLGNHTFKLISCPGHSPASLVLYIPEESIAIGGDVLFRDSIGRTDLPGGNHQALLNNIKNKIYTLPEDTIVYPGHGPETTIGYEKKNNPFVRE
ncbi:MBL fold metallo-hydrolase [Membranihabitans maritimus]|uniref:MBL fold metallo-hydrolase n=1 Tax=Membranihabitans maritimus TaxID=2904244 RepID=UPI001F337D94|nr:MBL fold metallo-hydrolase [Membranihabitans maritimus]